MTTQAIIFSLLCLSAAAILILIFNIDRSLRAIEKSLTQLKKDLAQ